MSSGNVYVLAAKDDLRSLILIGKIYALLHLLVMAIFFAVVWNNITFFRGYPRFGSPPIPGNYYNDRFSLQWGIMACPILGLLLPYMLLMTLTNPIRRIWSRVLFWYAAILLLVFSLAALALFAWYCGFIGVIGGRNTPWTTLSNQANDDRYCCVHYPTQPDRCSNTIDCPLDPSIGPLPVVTEANLETNSMFGWNWFFIAVQFLFAIGYLVQRASLKEYVARSEFLS